MISFQATFYPSYRDVHGYMSFIICILGSIANVLNIVVLTRKDMNTSPINRILTGEFTFLNVDTCYAASLVNINHKHISLIYIVQVLQNKELQIF